jgi:hypothetical protein
MLPRAADPLRHQRACCGRAPHPAGRLWVIGSALQNAASIAALFLTTAVVIVDKRKRNSAAAGGAPNMGGMDF